MLIAATETQIASFYSLSPLVDLEPRERRIMELFRAPYHLGRHPVELSRQQISKITGLPINTVTGRVFSLLAKTQLVVHGERIDPETHKAQELLRMPVFAQSDLFGEDVP